jgi:hypothetical protein
MLNICWTLQELHRALKTINYLYLGQFSTRSASVKRSDGCTDLQSFWPLQLAGSSYLDSSVVTFKRCTRV